MKICVLPGDGIGPEIMAEAVRVLHALDLKFEMEEALLGGCIVDATGDPYPEATQKLARAADAVLLAPLVARSGTACRAKAVQSAVCWVSARISTCSPTCARPFSTRNWPTPPP